MSDQTASTTPPVPPTTDQVVVTDEDTAKTAARLVRAKTASKKFFKVAGTAAIGGVFGGLALAAAAGRDKKDEDEYVPQSYDSTAPTE